MNKLEKQLLINKYCLKCEMYMYSGGTKYGRDVEACYHPHFTGSREKNNVYILGNVHEEGHDNFWGIWIQDEISNCYKWEGR
jgi:hypothetical protein